MGIRYWSPRRSTATPISSSSPRRHRSRMTDLETPRAWPRVGKSTTGKRLSSSSRVSGLTAPPSAPESHSTPRYGAKEPCQLIQAERLREPGESVNGWLPFSPLDPRQMGRIHPGALRGLLQAEPTSDPHCA